MRRTSRAVLERSVHPGAEACAPLEEGIALSTQRLQCRLLPFQNLYGSMFLRKPTLSIGMSW